MLLIDLRYAPARAVDVQPALPHRSQQSGLNPCGEIAVFPENSTTTILTSKMYLEA